MSEGEVCPSTIQPIPEKEPIHRNPEQKFDRTSNCTYNGEGTYHPLLSYFSDKMNDGYTLTGVVDCQSDDLFSEEVIAETCGVAARPAAVAPKHTKLFKPRGHTGELTIRSHPHQEVNLPDGNSGAVVAVGLFSWSIISVLLLPLRPVIQK